MPVPVHDIAKVGATQLAPLQYKLPDTLPAPEHVPPRAATDATAAPLPEVTQNPAVQVKPATVEVPVQTVPTVGVIQVAPLQ